jgi:hypothetical protein
MKQYVFILKLMNQMELMFSVFMRIVTVIWEISCVRKLVDSLKNLRKNLRDHTWKNLNIVWQFCSTYIFRMCFK